MKIQVLSLLVFCTLSSIFASTQQTQSCKKWPGTNAFTLSRKLVKNVFQYIQFYDSRIQIHHNLTDAQCERIFRRSKRDVSDYEFINIESETGHRTKRELRPVELKISGRKNEKMEKIELNLRPVEHTVMSDYSPVWLATTQRGRQYNYETADPEEKKIDGVFYEDPKKMATLLAYFKDKNIHYDGIFGEEKNMKVIKAAPEELHHSSANVNGGNHFIFDVDMPGKISARRSHKISGIEEKLDKPLDTFYVKLLVVLDYSLFKILGEDVQETVKYVATFWNSVNLKYSKVKQPQIKIMVTGLIISEDPTAMEYIYKSRDPRNLNVIDPDKLLPLAGQYFDKMFYNTTKFQNYDSIITMTSFKSPKGVIGLAYMGDICAKNTNVAYIKDDGNFGGVNTAAHELGHLLSLPHDGDRECIPYRNNDPTTVMSSHTTHNEQEHAWSKCSQKFFQLFAWDKRSSCLERYYRFRIYLH